MSIKDLLLVLQCSLIVFKFIDCNQINQDNYLIDDNFDRKIMIEMMNLTEIKEDFLLKENITIGFLTAFKDGGGKTVAGAVPLAIDFVNNNPFILPNHNLNYITQDVQKPYSSSGLSSMLKLYKNGVHAFIGPEETCK